MTYWAFLAGHPLFWSFVGGGALGCAASSATRSARRHPRPERARSRKWTAASLWLTLAVIGATCGIFLPGADEFLKLPSLYTGLGAAGFFLLALRFPRAGGIPALVVLTVVALAGALVMRPFVPVRDDATAATVTLISTGETSFMEINDYAPRGPASPRVVEVASPRVVAHVTFIALSDYLFFLGARGGVVLDAIQSAEEDSPPPVTVYSESPFVADVVDRVPLLRVRQIATDPTRLNLLREYRVAAYADGRVRMEARR